MYSAYNNQISQMDYNSLVTALTKQISPEVRSIILERLVQMNNQLLNRTQSIQAPKNIEPPRNIERPVMQNYRKKDAVEAPHPSMDPYARHNNFNIQPTRNTSNTNFNPQPKNNANPQRTRIEEFDIDDILGDINNSEDELDLKLKKLAIQKQKTEEDDLDMKLKKLTNLKQKIIDDNRKKKADKIPK